MTLAPAFRAAAWWLPAWLGVALLQSLAYDHTRTHWAELWGYSLGYVALPFWAGWLLPSLIRRDVAAAWRLGAAAACCVVWQLI